MINLKKIFLASILSLTACVSSFDKTEYERAVDIRYQISNVDKFCSSQDSMRLDIVKLQDSIDWLKLYAEGIPNNNQISVMLNGLKDEADRFANIVNAPQKPSATYCYSKINDMNAVADILLRSEGSKK